MKVREIEAKSVLVRSKLPDADYVINPYTGCAFLTVGIAWSPHLWLGTVIFAGITGWLLSYLVLSPGARAR